MKESIKRCENCGSDYNPPQPCGMCTESIVRNRRQGKIGRGATAADQPVKVIFRIWPKKQGGDVIALFPGLAGTNEIATCSSYQTVGQHGAADLHGLCSSLRLATAAEYASLKAELERIGYNLKVATRATAADRRARLEQVR